MSLWDAMRAAGWRYDAASNGFWRGAGVCTWPTSGGDDWVSFLQAERAWLSAEAGLDLSLPPANDNAPEPGPRAA